MKTSSPQVDLAQTGSLQVEVHPPLMEELTKVRRSQHGYFSCVLPYSTSVKDSRHYLCIRRKWRSSLCNWDVPAAGEVPRPKSHAILFKSCCSEGHVILYHDRSHIYLIYIYIVITFENARGERLSISTLTTVATVQ